MKGFMKMKEALVDISVLLIFFTRYEQFAQVFEQVRKAKPSRLFLYQDGPRPGRQDDIINIKKCRAIAENIDWDCEVHRLYQKKNVGVDPSGYIADTWAFSQTDKCIVLEDDVLPSVSFFSFCKKMLDKYENDDRIMLISGFNVEEETKGILDDYFFSRTTFTWGWATWARVVKQWDSSYSFLRDKTECQKLQNYIDNNGLVKNMLNVFDDHMKSGKEHFETILISNQYRHEGLTIVPKKNMINNIGVVEGSAHYAADIELIPKGYRRIFTMNRYEINTNELKHPEIIKDYKPYLKNAYRIYGWGHPAVKIYRQIVSMFYYLKQGKIKELLSDTRQKIERVIKRTSS